MLDICIDVCICTHNPRPHILDITLKSLSAQTVDKGRFRVLVVDNASEQKLGDSVLSPLREAGIHARLVAEETPGLSRARLKAIDETESDWVLFLDDDNQLAPDYLEKGLKVIDSIPDLGCFGGKLLLPDYIKPPRLLKPFVPYLAIKDYGDEAITDKTDYWGPWEPPGAGSFVKRPVLDLYKTRAQRNELFFKLGRTGANSVASCEDSLMMRGAVQLSLFCSYQPSLEIIHHINPDRLSLPYLMKLMYGFGVSVATCELLLDSNRETPAQYKNIAAFLVEAGKAMLGALPASFLYSAGLLLMHYGQYRTYRNK